MKHLLAITAVWLIVVAHHPGDPPGGNTASTPTVETKIGGYADEATCRREKSKLDISYSSTEANATGIVNCQDR